MASIRSRVAPLFASSSHAHRPSIVAALDETWRDALDGIARSRRWPTSHDVARLASKVAQLSAAYNDESARGLSVLGDGEDTMAARLLFSFVRDVPKMAAAVRELVVSRILTLAESRPLRVLDLGAGLGASTWGLARALAASGNRGLIDATWVDPDRLALDVARNIAGTRAVVGAVTISPKSVALPIEEGLARTTTTYDVVLLGQVLSELDRAEGPDRRVAKHVALVERIVTRMLASDGTVVIVEPALRERTRHLHRVRDALVAAGLSTVFAPCLHQAACPALRLETDWCHEDVDVDLPAWLVPIARGAGLRYQGLTFSYLVLRRDKKTLADAVAEPRGGRVRVVSKKLATKGKSELFLCGELGVAASSPSPSSLESPPEYLPNGARFTRLARDASAANAAWDTCVRGDLLRITPPPAPDGKRLDGKVAIEALQIAAAAGEAAEAK
jgi:ribosomal protein RSM22 (predicted rRNA methylase)